MVGADAVDLGDGAGVYSQPRRTTPAEAATLDPDARAAFRSTVVVGLRTMADALDAASDRTSGQPLAARRPSGASWWRWPIHMG